MSLHHLDPEWGAERSEPHLLKRCALAVLTVYAVGSLVETGQNIAALNHDGQPAISADPFSWTAVPATNVYVGVRDAN